VEGVCGSYWALIAARRTYLVGPDLAIDSSIRVYAPCLRRAVTNVTGPVERRRKRQYVPRPSGYIFSHSRPLIARTELIVNVPSSKQRALML
jgi:hypothetical protein